MSLIVLPQWHAHNLIRPSDLLTASAIRRITTESTSGSTSSHRVHLNLTIRVRSLDFDARAGQLHVAGRIARENKHTKIGQFHTLDLELNRNFTLEKEVEGKDGGQGWDSVAREQLEEATNPQRKAEIVAVVMEEGLANICFVTQYQTILRQKIAMKIDRKGGGSKRSTKHDKSLEKFFTTVLDTLLRQVEGLLEQKEEANSIPILLASPGFTAAGFLRYASDRAFSTGEKTLSSLIKRKAFVVVHSSSGHVHSLIEVLKGPAVMIKLKDTRYARETRLMNDFFDMLRKDEGRAWYGPKEVEAAVEEGAVGRGGGMLIISNELFRSQDVAVRRRWVRLVERVRKEEGGEVRILSSDHESGKRLEGLGGIAAILTYPLMDLDDEDKGVVNGNDPP
jgi:protein pelota